MSFKSSDSPPTKPSFPEKDRLSLSSGPNGFNKWLTNLLKYCSASLHNVCTSFIHAQPIPTPLKPHEHEKITQTAEILPSSETADVSFNTPSKLSNPLDPNSASSSESSPPGTIDTHPVFPVEYQGKVQTVTRLVHRYEHDKDGFLTPSGQKNLDDDITAYEAKSAQLAKETSELFKFIATQTIQTSLLESLEAHDNWSHIFANSDTFELRVVIQSTITPANALRSLDSFSKLLQCRQPSSMSDAAWSTNLKGCVNDFQINFAHPIHSDCISIDAIHAALILQFSKRQDWVQNLLLNQTSSISTLNPSKLYGQIANFGVNSKTYSNALNSFKETESED